MTVVVPVGSGIVLGHGTGRKIAAHRVVLPGGEVVVDADDGLRAALNDEVVGGLVAHFVRAIFEMQVLMAPHQVHEVVAGGQVYGTFGAVHVALTGIAHVEHVLKKEHWRAIHGQRGGIHGRQARVERVNVRGQLRAGVPAGVVAGGIHGRPHRVVVVHEGHRAVHVRPADVHHPRALLVGEQRADIEAAALAHHLVQAVAQREIERAGAVVHVGYPAIHLARRAHPFAHGVHGGPAVGPAGVALQVIEEILRGEVWKVLHGIHPHPIDTHLLLVPNQPLAVAGAHVVAGLHGVLGGGVEALAVGAGVVADVGAEERRVPIAGG